MRLEIAGADITDAVIEVLDTLQNDREILRNYIDTLERLGRRILLDPDSDMDSEGTLGDLRVLQMIRNDLQTLAAPPDASLPENDTPVFQA